MGESRLPGLLGEATAAFTSSEARLWLQRDRVTVWLKKRSQREETPQSRDIETLAVDWTQEAESERGSVWWVGLGTSWEMVLTVIEGRGVGQAVGLSRSYSIVLGRLANLTSMMSGENCPTGSLAHGFGAATEDAEHMGEPRDQEGRPEV